MRETENVKMIGLIDLLIYEGGSLDLYFTIELAANSETPSLRSVLVECESPPTGINSLFQLLRSELPHMLIVKNERNPSVLHLVDSSLRSSRDYVMEAKLDLAYSGTLSELPNALAEKLDGAITSRQLFTTSDLFGDWITQVEIKVRGEPIRRILTDHIPLQGYGRILWNAETLVTGPAPQTWVQYHGPERSIVQRP